MSKRVPRKAGTPTNPTAAEAEPRTKWSELRDRMPPARREAAAVRTAHMVAEMPLDELRHARREGASLTRSEVPAKARGRLTLAA